MATPNVDTREFLSQTKAIRGLRNMEMAVMNHGMKLSIV
jgi:hypothetical protein